MAVLTNAQAQLEQHHTMHGEVLLVLAALVAMWCFHRALRSSISASLMHGLPAVAAAMVEPMLDKNMGAASSVNTTKKFCVC